MDSKMTTKELERLLYKAIRKMGTYICFEVALPLYKWDNERVDVLSYETKGVWRCYELKISKNDFRSKCKLSFYGNFNYFVMPYELYEQVKDEIPKDIGVYVASKFSCKCIKRATRKEADISHDKMLFALMQGLYREYQKLRRLKEETI